MIISDSQKFAFLHVPKCAGTTIRQALLQYDSRKNHYWLYQKICISSPGKENITRIIDKAHLPLKILQRLYPRDYALLFEYSTFATCRHPRKRLISAFFEPRQALLKKTQTKSNRAIIATQKIFAEYISELVETKHLLNRKFIHAIPQHVFHINQGKVVTDSIIKLEDQDNGIKRLKAINTIAALKSEEALKSKRNKKYIPEEIRLWESLPRELKSKCESLYQTDCDFLGYNFNAET